jgi:hypothetical protein
VSGSSSGSSPAASSLQRSLGLDLESSTIEEEQGPEAEERNSPPTPLPHQHSQAPATARGEATPPPRGERLVLSPTFPTTPGGAAAGAPAAAGAAGGKVGAGAAPAATTSPSSPSFIFSAAGDANVGGGEVQQTD